MKTDTGMTLQQCADATGMAKSSIFRALKSGRISGARCADGTWRIEPSELFRCFEPVASATEGNDALERHGMTGSGPLQQAHQQAAQTEQALSELKAMLADMKADRDRWRDEAGAWREQAQASQKQLTDQRKPAPPAQLETWWRWLRSTG